MKTNQVEVEEMVSECFNELSIAHKEKYDLEKAEKTAALFLAAQLKLSFFIADIDLKARHSKHEIERIQANKYFQVKDENTVKKITEATLDHSIARDEEVIAAKRSWAEAEADLKKYNYLINMLKDGHIFFRGIAKSGKSIWNE